MRLLLCCILLTSQLFGQIGTGEWRLHVPAYKAVDIVSAGGKLFTAYTNGVSEYDVASGELSLWDAVNGLSDVAISCLGYSPSDNSVFVGYENGNLDKIRNNAVTNIPAIKLAQIQGSKTIHNIVAHDGFVYLATGFAIVKVDPIKNEVKDTYYPTNGTDEIYDVDFRNDTIFALTPDRMYTGLLNNPALADPTQWTEDPRVPVIAATSYLELANVLDEIYLVEKVPGYGIDTVYQLTNAGITSVINESFTMEIVGIDRVDNKLAVCYFDAVKMYDQFLGEHFLAYSYNGVIPQPQAIAYNAGNFYIADAGSGLVKAYGAAGTRIAINGPPKEDMFAMDWNRGKLVVAGGGISGIFLTYNHSGVYAFEDEEWTLYNEYDQEEWLTSRIWDYLDVSVNPTNPDEIAVGTFSLTPLSILNANGQMDSLTPNNSALAYHNSGFAGSLVSAVEYDEEGNLWVLNGYTNEPLKVYTKDKQWYTFDTGGSTKGKFTKRMDIDYNGHKWFIVGGIGIVGYNDGGTISSASDDKYVILNSGEGTGALPSNEVTALAVDFDNEIWIGTDNGFAVLYNSEGAFDAAYGEYNAQRIKVEFEGNVEYVLGATHITDIEVDGANRKWFGTSNAGIILLSADGLEIIEQHTVENSPLISNTIIDLEIDQNTGEMFIVTDQGLISYRTDATYEDPDYTDVQVFPNPARPGFEGPITIQGIKYDSDVKITDAAGNLIYTTSSNGGTATWNGKTLTGDRVPTGVYLIWTAPKEGKGRKVGKVLIVN